MECLKMYTYFPYRCNNDTLKHNHLPELLHSTIKIPLFDPKNEASSGQSNSLAWTSVHILPGTQEDRTNVLSL